MTTPPALELGVRPENVYLGAPGRLRPLPPPKPGVSPEGKRYAALSRSLNGTGTEWFFGTKRKWSADLPWCTPEERAWLELCWDGGLAPLWLIDPLTPNRLPKGVASTGSTLRGELGFTSDGTPGTTDEHPDFPDAPPFSVQVTASVLSARRVPVVPGERLTFTAWARSEAELTPFIRFSDTAGKRLDTAEGDALDDIATLTRFTRAASVPDGAAWSEVGFSRAERGPMVTAAWRVATDGAADWTPGGGAYRVAFTEKSSSSDRLPLETVSVTFEEL